MVQGRKNGFGSLFYLGGQLLYCGKFFNNEPHGDWVRMFYSNGKVEFAGRMKNGKREGWGVLYHGNGGIFYVGEFKVNEPNSKDAKLYRDNGVLFYSGVLRFGYNSDEEYYLHSYNNN